MESACDRFMRKWDGAEWQRIWEAYWRQVRYTGQDDALYTDWIFYTPEGYEKRVQYLTDGMLKGMAFGL